MHSHDKKVSRVAAYCRVSTDKEDQRNSLAAQQEFFRSYIQKRPDWKLVEIFADEGLSGTSTKRRPQFTEMVRRAMAGEIDLIITKEVSRFARNTVDTLQITRQLKSRGVWVLFLNDNINTGDNDGEFRADHYGQRCSGGKPQSIRTYPLGSAPGYAPGRSVWQ